MFGAKVWRSELPIIDHSSFLRTTASIPLWRYTDLSKFVDLLTSQRLWLSNAEFLALDDPYEGRPNAIQFPHRMWKSIDETPKELRDQILSIHNEAEDPFRRWFMIEEQRCLFEQFGRREFYLNCWHASAHESIAMWKVYATPGAGIAVQTNEKKLIKSFLSAKENMYLGTVQYWDPGTNQIGAGNVFDPLMIKRACFSYEQEVRLVHRDTKEFYDPLINSSWNEDTMRFGDIVKDTRPLPPGISVPCNVGALIERVVVSPFAPPWYLQMIERLRDKLNFSFPITVSKLLDQPPTVP